MTVRELMEALMKQPLDATVLVKTHRDAFHQDYETLRHVDFAWARPTVSCYYRQEMQKTDDKTFSAVILD